MPDIDLQYSQRHDVRAKMLVEDTKALISSGVDKVSSTVQGIFSGASFSPKSLFEKKDFPGRASKASFETSPEASKPNLPAGALFYPAVAKYYAMFVFNEYERIVANEAPREKTSVTIVLPMPANLNESFQVDYDTPALGPIIGSAADSVIKMARDLQDAPSTQGSNTEKTLGGTAAATVYAGTTGLLKKALGSAGETASQVASLATGVVPNPHLAVLFRNMNLREHTFSYKFSPQSSKELTQLKNIIKQLKTRMLPGMTKGSDMLFTFPDTCDISFGPNKEVPFKIKKCVMTSMSVNYAPDGPAFFKTGDPVVVELQMTFKEMSPFTRRDMGDKNERYVSQGSSVTAEQAIAGSTNNQGQALGQ